MFLVLYCTNYGDGTSSSPDTLHHTREGAISKIRDEVEDARRNDPDLREFDPEDTGTWYLTNHSWFDLKEMEPQE